MADRTKPSEDEVKKNGNVAAPAVDDFSDLDVAAPSEGIVVGESYLYRPGDQKLPGLFSMEKDKQGKLVNGVQAGKPHCGWLPIQGWLVQEIERLAKPGSGMRDYHQFEILLTKPTVALDGEKIRRCKAGDMIVVKAGGNLHSLRGAAHDPRVITEVFLAPSGEFIQMKDANKAPMRKWTKIVLKQSERKLVNVPRLAAYNAADDGDDDDFDPRRLEAARPELRA